MITLLDFYTFVSGSIPFVPPDRDCYEIYDSFWIVFIFYGPISVDIYKVDDCYCNQLKREKKYEEAMLLMASYVWVVYIDFT